MRLNNEHNPNRDNQSRGEMLGEEHNTLEKMITAWEGRYTFTDKLHYIGGGPDGYMNLIKIWFEEKEIYSYPSELKDDRDNLICLKGYLGGFYNGIRYGK